VGEGQAKIYDALAERTQFPQAETATILSSLWIARQGVCDKSLLPDNFTAISASGTAAHPPFDNAKDGILLPTSVARSFKAPVVNQPCRLSVVVVRARPSNVQIVDSQPIDTAAQQLQPGP
jgi:hypothetical protein